MWFVLAVAVLAVSSSAVLVRLAPAIPPIALALWRTTGSAALLAPAIRPMARGDLARTAAAGLFLAAHFVAWFASLHHTTVLRSTVLVCTTPLWTGLIEATVLRRPPSARTWLGFGVALAGVALMAWGGAPVDGGAWIGDALALLGGALAAVYLVLGRVVRARVGIGAYGAVVCACAALALMPVAVATDTQLLGFSWESWLVVAGITAGPQMLGHNGFNYALRYVSAAVVSAATLLEPVGAAALAALLLGEWPTALEVAGGAVCALGVFVVLRRPG